MIKQILFLLSLCLSREKNPQCITLYFYGSLPISLATLVGPFSRFPLSFMGCRKSTGQKSLLSRNSPYATFYTLGYTSKYQMRISVQYMQIVVILLKKTGKRGHWELVKEKRVKVGRAPAEDFAIKGGNSKR